MLAVVMAGSRASRPAAERPGTTGRRPSSAIRSERSARPRRRGIRRPPRAPLPRRAPSPREGADLMKTRWMLAIGIGLLLAAQGAVVQAQNLEQRPVKADDSAGAGREGQPYATAVDAAVAPGNAYLQNRQDHDA